MQCDAIRSPNQYTPHPLCHQPKTRPTHVLETDPLVVILKVPYPFVQPPAEQGLYGPSDRGDDAKHAREDVALGEHRDGVDQTCRAGRCGVGGARVSRGGDSMADWVLLDVGRTWDPDEHANRQMRSLHEPLATSDHSRPRAQEDLLEREQQVPTSEEKVQVCPFGRSFMPRRRRRSRSALLHDLELDRGLTEEQR